MGLLSSIRAHAAKSHNSMLRAGHELNAAEGLKIKLGRRAIARAPHVLKLRNEARRTIDSDALASVADLRDAEAKKLKLERAKRPVNKKK